MRSTRFCPSGEAMKCSTVVRQTPVRDSVENQVSSMARFRQMTIRKNACSESIPIDLTSKLGIIFNQPAAFRHRAHKVTFTLYECIKALPRYDELIPTSTSSRRLVPRFCKRSDLLSYGLYSLWAYARSSLRQLFSFEGSPSAFAQQASTSAAVGGSDFAAAA